MSAWPSPSQVGLAGGSLVSLEGPTAVSWPRLGALSAPPCFSPRSPARRPRWLSIPAPHTFFLLTGSTFYSKRKTTFLPLMLALHTFTTQVPSKDSVYQLFCHSICVWSPWTVHCPKIQERKQHLRSHPLKHLVESVSYIRILDGKISV